MKIVISILQTNARINVFRTEIRCTYRNESDIFSETNIFLGFNLIPISGLKVSVVRFFSIPNVIKLG